MIKIAPMQDQPPTARQTLLADIGTKWTRFSKQELADLKGNKDLVAQVVAKYGVAKAAAQRDVATLLKGRTF